MNKAICTCAEGSGLEFAGSSDPALRIALWTGIGVAMLSLSLLAAVVGLRAALVARLAREAATVATWRPLLLAVVEGVEVTLPRLKKTDHDAFLLIWNHLQESLRGDAAKRLNTVLITTGIDHAVRRRLRSRSNRQRLIAAATVGHLRDRVCWDTLLAMSREPYPQLSLVAARSLVTIDAAAALPELMPAFGGRSDWHVTRVVGILTQAGPAAVAPALLRALEEAPAAHLPRLIGFLDLVHADTAVPVLRQLLRDASDSEVVAACLRLVSAWEDLPLVRKFTTHPEGFVRIQAARALARIGDDSDAAHLIEMLSDPLWWVRHRAAESLAAMPRMDSAALARIRTGLTDRFAIDSLSQVMAARADS